MSTNNDKIPLNNICQHLPKYHSLELTTPWTPKHENSWINTSFAAPNRFLILVGKLYVKKGLCTHHCHQGGSCKTATDSSKASKSLKTNCPFKLKAKLNTKRAYWTLSHINTSHNHPPNYELKYIPPNDKNSNSTGENIDTFLYFLSKQLQSFDTTTQTTIVDKIKQLLEKQDSTHVNVILPSSPQFVAESQGIQSTNLDINHEHLDHPANSHSATHENSNVDPLKPITPIDSNKSCIATTDTALPEVHNEQHEHHGGTSPLPEISHGPSLKDIHPPGIQTNTTNITVPEITKKKATSTIPCSSSNKRPRTRKQLCEPQLPSTGLW